MTDLFRRLLEIRGVKESFLRPKYEDLDDPFELIGMAEGVERLKLAAERQEKVIIYGDYDVDGVTASTILAETLELLGLKEVEVMLPNRFTEGYGMSQKVIERAAETGVTLVMTVDCGSNNGEIITELSRKGIDVIVTDHHEISGELPVVDEGKRPGEAGGTVVVINPKREDFRKKVLQRQMEMMGDDDEEVRTDLKDIAGLLELCGAGVALMLARACVQRGMIRNGREKWLLDLAAIGTICDSMTLTGDNRIICYYGLIVLKKTPRKGLKELIRVAKVMNFDADAVGFQIGPRLNAAGRMKDASLAQKLLATKSAPEAAKYAKELDELNKSRKDQQFEATKEVAEHGVGQERVLVVEGPWHEGVLGIIAGRLTETYKRPCFVISSENGKGSGRSFGDFNLALALNECQEVLERGGGHAQACGVKVKPGMVGEFRKRVNQYYDSLRLRDQERFLLRKADLSVRDTGEFSLDFIEDLALLQPFGMGNEEPVFLLEQMTVLDVRKMGAEKQHLRLTVRDDEGGIFQTVAFYAPEEWGEVRVGEQVNLWVTITANEWQGTKTAEGRLVRVE